MHAVFENEIATSSLNLQSNYFIDHIFHSRDNWIENLSKASISLNSLNYGYEEQINNAFNEYYNYINY